MFGRIKFGPSVPVLLSLYLSLCPVSVPVFVTISVLVSLSLSLCTSTCTPVSMSLSLSLSLSLSMFPSPSPLSLCPSVPLSLCPSVPLSLLFLCPCASVSRGREFMWLVTQLTLTYLLQILIHKGPWWGGLAAGSHGNRNFQQAEKLLSLSIRGRTQ